ncbi:DUF6099 family protein [Streptomyces sp. NPDC093568]|uniref:DUF6099 family protein n=1 Tax=Streptomyces sp. NPDC093568 TaxID=3366041 RepID=UPI00382B9C9A
MGLEKRLREASRAVDGLWTDGRATWDRLAQLRRHLPSAAPSDVVGPPPDATTTPGLITLVARCRKSLASDSGALHARSSLRAVAEVAAVVGLSLVDHGPERLREPAQGLVDRIARLTTSSDAQAVVLTDTDDLPQLLSLLGGLLGEAGIAAVGVASSAEEEGTYWEMMEMIDTLDEARDTILEMLRRLSTFERAWSQPYAG